MKVYLVYWCNNEEWEDYAESVVHVFSTKEKATAYIERQGYKPHVPISEFDRRYMKDYYDSEKDEDGGYDSMWIREMEVDK